MGLRDVWSFLTFNNLPAAKIERADASELDLRSANAQMQVAYTVGKPQWSRREPSVYERDAYSKLSLIFRCINHYANAVAEAPLKVYKPIDQQPQELADHAMRQLITRPNPEMGEAAFWYNVAVRTAIYGFCVVEKVRSGARRPVELWPFNSEWMKVIPRADGSPDWQYNVPGHQPRTISAQDVAVFRFAERGNGDPYGIGGLEVSLREWSLLNTMQDMLKAFFDGGGLPVYGLIPEDPDALSKDEADLIREQWVSMTSFRNGPVKPPIMKSVKDIKRLSFDYNELAYIDLTDVSEIRICQAFGIPGSLVGQRFAQERNTFTNYKEARQSFYEDTIAKTWTKFDDVVTRSLLPDLEPNPAISVQFDLSQITALQEDQTAKRAHMLEAGKAGFAKRADYKRAAGLPVGPEDEVYLIPFNVVEVPAGKKQAQRSAIVTVRNVEPKMLEAASRATRGLVSLETRQRIETRANRVYTQAAISYGPKVQAFLDGQRDRVLAIVNSERAQIVLPSRQQWRALDDMERRDAISELLSLDWGQEDDLLDTLIRQLWNLMGETATAEATKLLGLTDDTLSWNISNPWVRQVLDAVGVRVTGINETTKAAIQQIVGDALNEGVTISELADRLESQFDVTWSGRAEAVARTESQVAYNHAGIASFRESGLVSEVEMLDNSSHGGYGGDADGLTCQERDGMIVSLDDASKHSLGTHPNCQLALAPVLITPLGEI